MKIAIFTLTKDRLDYTKRTFKSLREKTHVPFDHFVVDQGSKDKTVDWLNSFHNQLGKVFVYPLVMNIGINRGVNFAIDKIGDKYDIVVKLDNDCEIETDGWLKKCLKVLHPKLLFSPYVKGLIYNRGGVNRLWYDKNSKIGYTPFVGGICMIGLMKAWKEDSGGWKVPRPKHAGGDRAFCMNLALSGYKFGYKEDVVVKHIDDTLGQLKKYKKYFALRKQEKTVVF